MSPQGISNARKRSTIPYEKFLLFAERVGVSIDYLLLGKGSPGLGGGEVDPLLMRIIGVEFSERNPKLRETIGELGYGEAALIYNRIVKMAVPEERWDKVVSDEVDYLIEIREQDHREGTQRREISLHFEEPGGDSGEAVGSRANPTKKKSGPGTP